MSTLSSHVVHDVLFEFSTALACIPAPVDCELSGKDINTSSVDSSYEMCYVSKLTEVRTVNLLFCSLQIPMETNTT